MKPAGLDVEPGERGLRLVVDHGGRRGLRRIEREFEAARFVGDAARQAVRAAVGRREADVRNGLLPALELVVGAEEAGSAAGIVPQAAASPALEVSE